MTFIVHIGTHKTGTTATQRFAAAHRKELRRRGVWYPSYADIGLPGHYRGHHDFAHAIAGDSKRFSLDDAERFADHIRTRRRPGETVLLSAEPIYRHILSDEGDYWASRETYLRELRKVIGVDEITILAVLRRQDAFARSLYQEKVKSGKYALSFRQFLVDDRAEFEYHKQLSLFRKVFTTVDVLVYEDIVQPNLVNSFFAHLGVDVSDLPGRPVENASLPLELVEYKRLLNATTLRKGPLGRAAVKIEKRAGKGDLQNHVDWISREDMEAFYTSFDDENERLRRDFACDRTAPLFPSLLAVPVEEREVYGGMSAHRFAELTGEIFLR